jgi:hypothetical protein
MFAYIIKDTKIECIAPILRVKEHDSQALVGLGRTSAEVFGLPRASTLLFFRFLPAVEG